MKRVKACVAFAILAAAVAGLWMVPASANVLVNPGFETGNYSGWVRVGPSGQRFDGVSQPYFGPASPFEGIRMAGAAANWSNAKDKAYIYQIFAAPAGPVTVSGWGHAWNLHNGQPGNPSDTQVLIGWDPLGGTNPDAASVVWAEPILAVNQWQQRVITGNSPGGNNTVFARVRHIWAIEWNATYVDAFEATVVPEPGSLLALAGGLSGFAGLLLRRRA